MRCSGSAALIGMREEAKEIVAATIRDSSKRSRDDGSTQYRIHIRRPRARCRTDEIASGE